MFTTNLVLETYKPDLWIIAAPLRWVDTQFGKIDVPQGFITDLASIPRALRGLPDFDPNGVSRRPAAMHDWLYAWRKPGKDFADNFLRSSLRVEGASELDACAFYDAVHYFGSDAWNSDARVLDDVGLEGSFDTAEHFQAWMATPRTVPTSPSE